MLRPDATNTATCTLCAWKVLLDPMSPYRGSHPHSSEPRECQGMLLYEEVSPLPVEVTILGRDAPYGYTDEGVPLLPSPADVAALEVAYAARGDELEAILPSNNDPETT